MFHFILPFLYIIDSIRCLNGKIPFSFCRLLLHSIDSVNGSYFSFMGHHFSLSVWMPVILVSFAKKSFLVPMGSSIFFIFFLLHSAHLVLPTSYSIYLGLDFVQGDRFGSIFNHPWIVEEEVLRLAGRRENRIEEKEGISNLPCS